MSNREAGKGDDMRPTDEVGTGCECANCANGMGICHTEEEQLEQAFSAKPCRSPYCECEQGKCTRLGFYDARHEPASTGDRPRALR